MYVPLLLVHSPTEPHFLRQKNTDLSFSSWGSFKLAEPLQVIQNKGFIIVGSYTVGKGVYGRLCLWWWAPSCWRSAGQAVEKKSWVGNGGKGLTRTHKNKLKPIRTN